MPELLGQAYYGLNSVDYVCRAQVADDGLHGEEVVARSHGRACASVCAFFALIAACIKQVSRAPMLAGVYVI